MTQLVDIYYTSIGRNGNLILNLSPDKRGLIPDDQLEALSRTAQIINETFATNLAAGGKLTADNSNPPTVRRSRWTATSTPGGKPRPGRPTAR